jgi:CRISPR-associated protein Csd1
MILAALKEYHDRLAANGDIAPPGWDKKGIDYIVVIDRDGNPVNLECTQEKQGKKMVAKSFLVPSPVKRSSGVKSNLLWDNIDYTLGICSSDDSARTAECHAAFIARIEELDLPENEGIIALKKFLAVQDKEQLLKDKFGKQEDMESPSAFFEQEDATAKKTPDSKYDEMLKNCQNLTFRLQGSSVPILNDKEVMACINKTSASENNAEIRRCLVTGEYATIARLHPPVKGVRGAQSSGANIVSYNAQSFCSYGMEQGYNAPVGKEAAEAYTKAINILLGRDSGRSFLVGDATTIAWSEKPSRLEEEIVSIFTEPPKDNPDKNVEAVRALFNATLTGSAVNDESNYRFYVLGLSPNASRISIRFWITGTVASMSERIKQHFKDTEIIHNSKAPDYLSLFRLFASTAMLGKPENIPPNLVGATMRAILAGLPYPATLLQCAVIRNRAEQKVTYPRAALIKGCLNRSINSNERKIEMALDTENTNVGYRLGRLFATLEKIQTDAHPWLNATIRDRFYGAASGTPRTVFGNLMRLKNFHLGKLSEGSRIFYERLIAEILQEMVDFPGHLNMADQGRFAIGYYHQNQSFYTKRTNTDKNETDNAAPEEKSLF